MTRHRQETEAEVERRAKDLSRADEELRFAKERAEEGARLKSEFVANMSHEIRTPMNGIVGILEAIKESETTPELREAPDVIRTSAESLDTIVNDIPDFSEPEAGKLEIDCMAAELWAHAGQIVKDAAH